MAKLSWGNLGEKLFEVGVDRGVLYPQSEPGVAWSGLVSVNEAPTGGESSPRYMDGIRYSDHKTIEHFEGTIEAYTYPAEFARCDGTDMLSNGLFATQQYRRPFGLTYRTKVGNDIVGPDHGYKIHIVYNAKASPSPRSNQSISDSPEAIVFSWQFTTIPERISGIRPTAHLIIDSTKTDPAVLSAIEDLLYGTETAEPALPTPGDLIEIYLEGGPVEPFVVNEPDENGIFTITGPTFEVLPLDVDHFMLDTEYVVDNGDGTFTATSE